MKALFCWVQTEAKHELHCTKPCWFLVRNQNHLLVEEASSNIQQILFKVLSVIIIVGSVAQTLWKRVKRGFKKEYSQVHVQGRVVSKCNKAYKFETHNLQKALHLTTPMLVCSAYGTGSSVNHE